jgi:hypothetical protein
MGVPFVPQHHAASEPRASNKLKINHAAAKTRKPAKEKPSDRAS